jgi:hypothetical protein
MTPSSEATSDPKAWRRDPYYRRFVRVLAMILYDNMEREGTLPPHWRRPGKREEGAMK